MQAVEGITSKVKALYEAFPYPHYPLFAPLRWQDGYLSSLAFVRRLLADQHIAAERSTQAVISHRRPRILLAGSGEALPYIMGKMEPSGHYLTSIDISARSMRRARTRMLWTWRRKEFIAGDLNQYLTAPSLHEHFDHIDSFGVLHHLANPAQTLRLLAQSLKPGGTARFMVYNSVARNWITQLQQIFRLLHLDLHHHDDRKIVLDLLTSLRHSCPYFNNKLRYMGEGTLHSDTRLVDTFMHTHEIRWDIKRWLLEFNAAGLQPFGLFDRYGELDDLPNTLWQMPSSEELELRAGDGRFEGNLEVYLHKPDPRDQIQIYTTKLPVVRQHYLRGAPSWWNTYEETEDLSAVQRQLLWWRMLMWSHHELNYGSASIKATPRWQRLARLGAVLPGQCDHATYQKLLRSMTVDAASATYEKARTPTKPGQATLTIINKTLAAKKIDTLRRRTAILQRLDRLFAALR